MDSVITIQNVMPSGPRTSAPEAAQKDGKPAPTGGKELPPAPDLQSVQRAVKQINTYLADSQRALNFQIHEASGRTIVRVINPETNEVIRQIPSEEVLNLAAAIQSQGLQLARFLLL
jgi:flagellar protein FlaG